MKIIKTKIGKILMILIIFILVLNFISPVVLATDPIDPGTLEEDDYPSTGGITGGDVLDWGGGLLAWPLKLVMLIIGQVLESITNVVAGQTVSPETILFNKVDLVNINFFDSNSSEPFVKSLRENVASWYYAIRNIAIIASVCVLLYVAIRMATSTIAEEKAKYKSMLMDWAVSFALIFVLHYIAILTIYGNNVIVDMLKTSLQSTSGNSEVLTSYMATMKKQAWFGISFTESFGAALVYIVLLFVTLGFLIMYIKRLIITAFLIIIAPLITITYAIDKVGDGKSQALNNWAKEFIWTILIQPFHCLIYLVFVTIAFDALKAQTLASSVLAIMCMLFIMQAENIVKKIFGIQAEEVGKLSSSMALAVGGFVAMKKFAGNAKDAGAPKNGGDTNSNINTKPKTKDEQLLGGGNTGGTARDASDLKGNVGNGGNVGKTGGMMDSEAVKNAKEKMSDVVNSKVGQGLINYGKWSYDKGWKVFGATAGAAQGGGADNMIAGWVAGGMAGDAVAKRANAIKEYTTGQTAGVLEERRTRNASANLRECYNEMKQSSGYTDDQMAQKAATLIRTDLQSTTAQAMSDMEKAFAANLQRVQAQLEKTGQDSSLSSVLNKINLRDVNNNNNDNSNNNNDNNNNN